MTEKQNDDLIDFRKLNKSTNSERENRLKFKDSIKHFKFIGNKRKIKLINKYGDFLEEAIDKIEEKQNLDNFLKERLGSYYKRIKGTSNKYNEGEIGKTILITSGVILLGKKFIDIFVHESHDILKRRRNNVYLSLFTVFIVIFSYCIFYFLFILPMGVEYKPKGNFIFPGDEKTEWIFTMIMALLTLPACSYLASFLLSHITLKLYTKSIKKNQKLGLVPIENLFGSALYRKLLFRAIILGFFVFNLSYTLASQKLFVTYMRSVYPEGINLIPDPELMIQIMWIVAIPCTLILVPIWLMMDIGLVKTQKVKGFEFESVNLSGSKVYKLIKGYAGIGFIYNLVLLIFVWASDNVHIVRVIMRAASPIIAITFMLPLVILIDYNNESFKVKLWKKLKKYEINKILNSTIKIDIINNYEDILKS